MEGNGQETQATTGTDVPARRAVTYSFAIVSLLTWALLWWLDPRSTLIVVLVDAWLIQVAVAYRMPRSGLVRLPWAGLLRLSCPAGRAQDPNGGPRPLAIEPLCRR